jgi:hypothetical protein
MLGLQKHECTGPNKERNKAESEEVKIMKGKRYKSQKCDSTLTIIIIIIIIIPPARCVYAANAICMTVILLTKTIFHLRTFHMTIWSIIRLSFDVSLSIFCGLHTVHLDSVSFLLFNAIS